MIRTEMRRAFCSKAFLAACIVMLVLLCRDSWFEFEYLSGRGELAEGTWQEKFLEAAGYGEGHAVFFSFFAVVIPYVLSYRKERDSGYRQLMTLKSSGSVYRRAKLLAVAASGAGVMCLPLLCWMPVCFLLGTGRTDPHGNNVLNLISDEMLPLLENRQTLLVFLYIVNAALVGAVFALFGLGVSAVLRNRYPALLFPFGFCLLTATVICHWYGPAWNAFILPMLGFDLMPNRVRIGYLLLLSTLGVGLFIGGDRHAEKA